MRKEQVLQKLKQSVPYVVCFLIFVFVVNGCLQGSSYWDRLPETNAAKAAYRAAQEDFEREFSQFEEERDWDGSVISRVRIEVSEDTVSGLLYNRSEAVRALQEQLWRDGRFGIVSEPTWQIRGGFVEAPEPTVFIIF